jgi:flavin-dependent dehydrogenase
VLLFPSRDRAPTPDPKDAAEAAPVHPPTRQTLTTKAQHHEVIVVGGGPAGCAAATLLARRSHKVALIRPTIPTAASLAESVPPSASRILEELGFAEAVERGGFHPNRGNSVWWANQELREERFPEDQAGYHTDRAGLESVLIEAANQAGVRVYEGTTARTAQETDEGWVLRCEVEGEAEVELAAPWVIDATGRHGFLARKEGREPDRSTTTLALVRRWRQPTGWEGDDGFSTLIESYSDGWAWSVPMNEHVRCFTAMVDQRSSDLSGAGVGSMLDAELAKTTHMGPMLSGAVPEGDAWACPASLYTASLFARPGLLLAGDAGSFIDPLSSFGVKKALSSGWLAGVAVHTALIDDSMTETATSFFDAREREVYRSYRRTSAQFFEAAHAAHGGRYWSDRAAAARRAGGDDPATHRLLSGAQDPDRITPEVPEADVRHAFGTIKELETLSSRAGSSLRTFERPGIDGQRIVLQDHLGSDTYPEGMRYVRGVDLRHLVRMAPQHSDVADGWTAYNDVAPPVSLPDYLTALATAFAARLLEHVEH